MQQKRDELSQRHAYLIHKDVVQRLKKQLFPLPPRRSVDFLESKMDSESLKSSEDTAISEESFPIKEVKEETPKFLADSSCSLISRIITIFSQYEEFLSQWS